MARPFSNAKLYSSLVVDRISNVISRRGYAVVAAQGVVSSGVRREASSNAAAVKQTREEKVSWVPDPVTGCYRPENCANEIDVAELRAMLLKKK